MNNLPQYIVAIVALVGITVLGALHDIDSNALTAVYSAVIAGVLGHAVGVTQGQNNATAPPRGNP